MNSPGSVAPGSVARGSGSLKFTVLKRDSSSNARLGRVETSHGSFDTPAFMPVGTKATIKGIVPEQVRGTGTQIILCNAYHLLLRPGDDLIAQRGGLHKFMRWDGPILTDSGGYQVYSLAHINSIDEDGVTFASSIDGSRVHLSPERSMQIQNNLGADIIMAFDDCPPAAQPVTFNAFRKPGGAQSPKLESPKDQSPKSKGGLAIDGSQYRERLQLANERTARWLERCRKAHARASDQALFGIVQGGIDEELRRESVELVCNIDLPGYAIGGVAVGESTEQIHAVVSFTAPLLPADKPRYLMGVGYEHDIVAAVRAGMDMFDCVLPTRNGRNANAFTPRGRLHLRNAVFRDDDRVIDDGCDCAACKGGFSRAYLRHLFAADEMLGPILVSIHNVRHFQRLLLDIRKAIREDGGGPHSRTIANRDPWPSFYEAWPVAAAPVSWQGAAEQPLNEGPQVANFRDLEPLPED